MLVINARNVHDALPRAARAILEAAPTPRSNRNEETLGKTLVYPGPVCTVYERPWERVLLWPQRDANPFFHLLESIWMLAGRNDVAFPTSIVSNFGQYSDDGKTYHAAYGHRWRHHFGRDQLPLIIEELCNDRDTRRVVLQMWDAPSDLGGKGKDLPCNTHAYFGINAEGALDMTVCCRSNDAVFGAYGANAVHFSFLQEFIAGCVGVPMGRMWQLSNNWHFYEKTAGKVLPLADLCANGYVGDRWVNPYENDGGATSSNFRPALQRYPMLHANECSGMTPAERQLRFLIDAELFVASEADSYGYSFSFFHKIAKPMLMALRAWQNKEVSVSWRAVAAKEILAQMPEQNDWRVAAEQWIKRRVQAHQEKAGSSAGEG